MSSLQSPVDGVGSSSSSHTREPPILRLPPETLRDIFAFAQPEDLASLSRVSRSFRDIAAAELYRSLSHIFSDDPDIGNYSVDSLAGILETLTTSDYNYAQNIKEIRLDTAYSGEPGERAMREFRYEYSCGKFLNTLFLSTIKKIASLETFRWNIRVEISPSVFAALAKLDSLQHLHIRLQSGPSLHASSSKSHHAPIFFPQPTSSIASPLSTHGHQHQHHHHHHHHHHQPPTSATISPYMINNKSHDSNVKLTKRLGVHKLRHGPRNFSLFSNLKSLAVLDMDTLEYIPEIAACITSSTTRLKELKLSFSDSLALKARKKTVVANHSDTETSQEDEMFDDPLLPSPPPPPMLGETSTFAGGSTFPTNDADVRRERAAQEKVLAQIFNLGKESGNQTKLEKAAERVIADAEKEVHSSFKVSAKVLNYQVFEKELRHIMKDLVQKNNDHASLSDKLKTIESFEKVATKYFAKKGNPSGPSKQPKKAVHQSFPSLKMPAHKSYPKPIFGTPIPPPAKIHVDTDLMGTKYLPPPAKPSSALAKQILSDVYQPPKPTGSSKKILHKKPAKSTLNWQPSSSQHPIHASSTSASEVGEITPLDNGPDDHVQGFSFSFKPETKVSEDQYLDIVDMEHPDYDEDEGEDQEFIDASEDPTEDSGRSGLGVQGASSFANGSLIEEESQANGSRNGKEAVLPDSKAQAGPSETCSCATDEEGADNALHEYIRLNHGMPLESLSIYLIPVKASVLCRAINMTSLKHISLLNVGPQRPFWAMLAKLHKSTPLQIESIHTDNVTTAFLTFVNGLDYVKELFMLERTSRAKVENLAPKTTVMMDDITNLVLRKHSRHLVRLMLRNDENSSWALNREAVRLITKYGAQLKELVVGVGSARFHTLMQNIGGLRSLNLLNIIFYHTDFCTSLLREIRSCAIDNVLHCPHLKIRYVAVSYMMGAGPMTTSVSEIVRKTTQRKTHDRDPSVEVEGKGKGKAVDVSNELPEHFFAAEDSLGGNSDTDDDFEDDSVGVIEGIKLKNVVGAKVWEKEVWCMTL